MDPHAPFGLKRIHSLHSHKKINKEINKRLKVLIKMLKLIYIYFKNIWESIRLSAKRVVSDMIGLKRRKHTKEQVWLWTFFPTCQFGWWILKILTATHIFYSQQNETWKWRYCIVMSLVVLVFSIRVFKMFLGQDQ